MPMYTQHDASAERLVEALCEVPMAEWRMGALAAAADPRASRAATALEQALRSADPVRLWNLYDDLEIALHRLTTDEALGVVHGWQDRECIRAATRRAVGALVCRNALSPDHLRALTEPFIGIAAGLPGAERVSATIATIGPRRRFSRRR